METPIHVSNEFPMKLKWSRSDLGCIVLPFRCINSPASFMFQSVFLFFFVCVCVSYVLYICGERERGKEGREIETDTTIKYHIEIHWNTLKYIEYVYVFLILLVWELSEVTVGGGSGRFTWKAIHGHQAVSTTILLSNWLIKLFQIDQIIKLISNLINQCFFKSDFSHHSPVTINIYRLKHSTNIQPSFRSFSEPESFCRRDDLPGCQVSQKPRGSICLQKQMARYGKTW